MTREAPAPRCVDIGFSRPYPLAPAAEVALEDYARVVAGASAAEAVVSEADPGGLRGVHLCDPATRPDAAVRDDIEAFARELSLPASDRLGWS